MAKITAKTRSLTLTLLAFAVPLALTACTDNGPWPLPTGYTYYAGKYRAPLGPEPGVDHKEHPYPASNGTMTTTTDTTTSTMTTSSATGTGMDSGATAPSIDTQAANDLVAKLFANFGKPTGKVWIRPAHGASRDFTFENALHSALVNQGLHISDVQGGGPYAVAYRVNGSNIKLTLVTGGRKAAEAGGFYDLNGGGGGYASPASPAVETAPVSSMTPDTSGSNFTVAPPTPTAPPPMATPTSVSPEVAVPPGAASTDTTTTTSDAPGTVSSPPTDIAPAVISNGAGGAPPPPDTSSAASPSVTTDMSAVPPSSGSASGSGATAPASRGAQTYHLND